MIATAPIIAAPTVATNISQSIASRATSTTWMGVAVGMAGAELGLAGTVVVVMSDTRLGVGGVGDGGWFQLTRDI